MRPRCPSIMPFTCALHAFQTCLSHLSCMPCEGCLSDMPGACCARVSWNSDGSQLMSASDDRTVRVWTVTLTAAAQADTKSQGTVCLQAAPVLYGHSARLWDCQFGEGILITASEDCTARCVPCHLLILYLNAGSRDIHTHKDEPFLQGSVSSQCLSPVTTSQCKKP